MTEIEVFLKKEIGADLGSRQKIEKLFKNILQKKYLIFFWFANPRPQHDGEVQGT